ncbi:Hypothetical protein IALB_0575 [Ignavibacterium album JCM 16511]|uniref:Lipoprotein n=1 Tax=Ignavibacterium album (strain DSM 19864 / JCM 16511 / NBRC 101810 / Mat9-16) TaxID=945713 RepID=I0AH30_IGNAJ|nr:DUF5694 domain-containing protein [Ignavibacterium album]AFH48287.1 Hypothetical protein IALB_0575 [Ignavibacterium album JCM 16511]
MRDKIILLLALITFLLVGCLKEMPDKELTVSIESEDPIRNLQKLTPDEFKTNVMILGVPPLNVLRKDFSPALLDSLIYVLKKFNPSLICIDGISPKQIEVFQHLDKYHSKLAHSISAKEINLAESVRKKYKISYAKAVEEVDSLLRKENANNNISVKERLEVIKNLIATYDIYSASLQWSYLNKEEKSKADLENSVKEELEQLINSNDENSSIGIRLARELKLQKLYPINDYSDKFYLDKISDKLYEDMLISEVYLNSRKDILDYQSDKKLKEALAKKNLLPFFKHINSVDYLINSSNKNWGIYYKMFLDSGLDRTRVALWEMKCLRIAANIREISSFYPGKNILVIIDVSAKPFLEEYLKSMGDIQIMGL